MNKDSSYIVLEKEDISQKDEYLEETERLIRLAFMKEEENIAKSKELVGRNTRKVKKMFSSTTVGLTPEERDKLYKELVVEEKIKRHYNSIIITLQEIESVMSKDRVVYLSSYHLRYIEFLAENEIDKEVKEIYRSNIDIDNLPSDIIDLYLGNF